jgi:hypothetical protein
MDAAERRRTEAAMAKISGDKRAVEADPEAAIRDPIDAAKKQAKRRLWIAFWIAFLAAAVAAFYAISRR